MPKQTKSKKGKQLLRPRRGLDGRWITPSPDPEPPDTVAAKGETCLIAATDEIPVTTGGLVIREPSPSLCAPSPIASPQAGALAVRPATANSKEAAQQPGLLLVTATAVRPSINQPDIT